MLSITITALIYFIINYYLDCKKVNNIQINYDQDINIDNLKKKDLTEKVMTEEIKKTESNSQSLEKKYKKDSYELIFYWANWCGVCQKIKPLWKQARTEIEKIYKNVNIKEVNCDTPSVDKCFINTGSGNQMLDGVPTILLRSNGIDVEYKKNDFLTGDRSKNDLMKFLEINLKK